MSDSPSNDALSRARDEIIEALGPDIPVDAATIGPPRVGWMLRRARSMRLKTIQNLRPMLAQLLRPEERIRFLTTALLYNPVEFYFQGAMAAYGNSYLLVLTNQRLLMLQVMGARRRAGDLKNAVPLSAIRKIEGRLRLQLRLCDGKKLSFSAIAGADRKHLQSLLRESLSEAVTSDAGGIQHLCPACLEVVPGRAGDTERCPQDNCRIPLRSARQAALLSALVPGVGDLYLRHFVAGAFEFLGSMMVLAIAAVVALMAFYDGTRESWLAAALFGAIGLLLPRIIDYPLTLHMARKGNVPRSYESPALPGGGVLRGGMPVQALPMFPGWSVAMFALSALAFVGVLVAVQSVAVAQGQVEQAVEAAEQQRWSNAETYWQAALDSGAPDADDYARMALAYLKAGRFDEASGFLAAIGDAPVDAALVEQIEAQFDAEPAGAGSEGP